MPTYTAKQEKIATRISENASKSKWRDWKWQLKNAVKGINNPEDKLNAYMTARYKQLQEHNKLYHISEEVVLELLPMVHEKWREYLNKEAGILQKILNEGVELGVFDTPDTDAVAQIILSAIEGAFAKIFLYDSKEDASESLSTAIWVILNGIKKRQSVGEN